MKKLDKKSNCIEAVKLKAYQSLVDEVYDALTKIVGNEPNIELCQIIDRLSLFKTKKP